MDTYEYDMNMRDNTINIDLSTEYGIAQVGWRHYRLPGGCDNKKYLQLPERRF